MSGTCDVCGESGKSQHSEPDGDTFWLCAGCEEACAEVAREGQYVSLEDASNGI